MQTDSGMFRCILPFVLAVLTILAIFIHRDFGMCWDAPVQAQYAGRVIRYYRSGFADRALLEQSPESLGYVNYYGAFFDLIAESFSRMDPVHSCELRNLASAFFGIIGIWACASAAGRLGGAAAGILAAILLTTTPMFFGHMFINPKDIPFAAMYVLALKFLIDILSQDPVSPRSVWGFGIAFGCCAGIRAPGIFLLFLLVVGLMLRVRVVHGAATVGWSRRLTMQLTGSLIAGWTIMISVWPWAQANPVLRPIQALRFFSHFPNGDPWRWRLPVYLSEQLPTLHLVLAAVALVFVLLTPRRRTPMHLRSPGHVVILLAWSLPLLLTVATHPRLYNAIRHYLFILPPLMISIAITIIDLIRRSVPCRFRRLVTLTVLIGVATPPIGAMIELHPYEYTFFNRLSGGLSAAAVRNRDMEYWGVSMKEGVEELDRVTADRTASRAPAEPVRVLLSQPAACAEYWFPKRFRRVLDPSIAEYYLTILTWNQHEQFPGGEEIVRIEREGVPFCIVRTMPPPGEPSGPTD